MAKTEKSAAELYREERKARLAKSAKKNAKKSISSQSSAVAGKVITILLVVAVIVSCCAVVVNQSGILPRSRAAFTVGEEKVSEAEYSYYYQSIYNMYMQYAYYGYSIGLDTSKAPSAQEYTGVFGDIEGFPEDQTPTWADFIEYSAKERIRYVKAAKATCDELQIALDDSDITTVNDTIEEYDEYAASASSEGSRYSLSAYLKASFGKGMNKKLFEKILTEQQLSTKLQETKSDEYKAALTEKQINKEYNSNITDYAVVDYYSYSFKIPSASDEDADEKTVKKEMADAKTKAESFAKSANMDNFGKLAYDAAVAAKASDAESYKNEDFTLVKESTYSDLSSKNSDDDFLKWAFSKNTKAGETFVAEDEDTGYTVFMIANPMHKAADYTTYDSRHILVNFVEEEEAESTENTDTDSEETTAADDSADAETTEAETTEAPKEKEEETKVETLDVSAYEGVNVDLKVNAETAKNIKGYEKAQEILKKYLDGEHTEEAFAALAEENSSDTGSNSNGGLYEGTKAGDFVEPYDTWCLEKGRKEGDIALVEYDGSNYSGYHIIYYIKSDVVSWDEAVKDAIASEKINDYVEDILEKDIAKIGNENEKAKTNVEEFLNDMIKSSASSSSSY